MSTLKTPPLAPLLARLFADAEASTAKLRRERAKAPPDDAARRAQSSDYRAFYSGFKEYHLAVSPQTGALLYMLARSMGARSMIEFGTSFGISTLHLAAALKDNGGGRLISTEFEPSKIAQARNNLRAANLHELVEIREGDALETLAGDSSKSAKAMRWKRSQGICRPLTWCCWMAPSHSICGCWSCSSRACGPAR